MLALRIRSGAEVGGCLHGACGVLVGPGRRTRGRVGYGDGISRRAGISPDCSIGTWSSMEARKCCPVARDFGSRRGGGSLRCCLIRLSACGIWGIPSQLFVLRSQFIFVHATTGIHGADVSAPGQAAEDSVWML